MSRKRFTTADGYTPKDLLIAARDHLIAANCLLKRCRLIGLDSAGYLLHLGAELILKAWLLHADGGFPDSHDVSGLAGKLNTRCSAMTKADVQDKLKALDGFNALRYPMPDQGRSIAETTAQELFEFVSEYLLGVLLPSELQTLGPVFYSVDEKGRFRKDKRFIMKKRRDEEPES